MPARGVNNIPVPELSRLGVPVFNAPGANANAVKELVLAGMLIAARNLAPALGFVNGLDKNAKDLEKQVEGGKKAYAGVELPGHTLGVIGLGKIGSLVADAAIRLGMDVIGYDPEITVDAAWSLPSQVKKANSLDELLRASDFVTLHVPLVEKTKHLVNAKNLALLKPGSVLLNFSREGVIEDAAVLKALEAKQLRSYVTDFPSAELIGRAGVVALPHLGASTAEAEDNCAVMVADQVREYMAHGTMENAVNFPNAQMPRESPYRLAIANANVPNMLANISQAMGSRKINIHNMLNKSKKDMAYTLVDVDSPVPDAAIKELCAIQGVLSVRYLPVGRMSEQDIKKLRSEIDGLDTELLALLNRRAAVVKKVGGLKDGKRVYRPEREAEILRRVAAAKGSVLPAGAAAAVFREIISACRALEQEIRVAYLGPQGTFSEQAVRQHFGHAVAAEPAATIDEAFRSAESGATQFAVAPAENSTDGAVGRTLDLLLTTPLRICGEIDLRVKQNLLSRMKGLKEIRKIYSHAQSLAQCNGWLGQNLPKAERIPVGSNAEAARRAAKEKGAAAIAGEAAAALYKLKILAAGIEDDPNNTTRFLVLGQIDAAPTGRDRTSLAMSAENKPGSVHALLSPIAANGVSMSRIESRPAKARSARWEYVFFIDLEGHQSDTKVAAAIAELKQRAPFLKVLGSYPAAVS